MRDQGSGTLAGWASISIASGRSETFQEDVAQLLTINGNPVATSPLGCIQRAIGAFDQRD